MDGISPTGRPPPSAFSSCPRRIVVGVSEGQASRDALVFANAFVEAVGSRLIAASVRPYWPALLGPERYCRLVNDDIERTARDVREVVEDVSFSTRVVAGGHEGGGLRKLAVAEGADLIVVGSSQHGRTGYVTPGSLGERILGEAPCAVALTPLGLSARGVQLRELTVAIDGSREARAAQRLAFGLADATGAHLSILAAVEPEPGAASVAAASRHLIRESRVRRHLDQAMGEAPPGISIDTHLLDGPPHRVLAEATESSDLLVLGPRSRYKVSRSLSIGSVVRQVTRQARCPILIASPS